MRSSATLHCVENKIVVVYESLKALALRSEGSPNFERLVGALSEGVLASMTFRVVGVTLFTIHEFYSPPSLLQHYIHK